jgi:hypothetical protein
MRYRSAVTRKAVMLSINVLRIGGIFFPIAQIRNSTDLSYSTSKKRNRSAFLDF